MEYQPIDEAPRWFQKAVAVPHEQRSVIVDGANVNFLTWGEIGRPGLIFVHGGGAHAHWWTHVAAQFADRYRVGALDLTGHGDSDHRSQYSMSGWAEEVMTVAGALGCAGPPVLIGHSMGGFVTIVTAAPPRRAPRRDHRL